MTSLASLETAYAALGTIFRTELTPLVNGIGRRTADGATYDEVAADINRARSEFDNAYARVFEILQQAQQITPRPDAFIAQLERSLNTNQSNNRATLAQIEIEARDNQAAQDQSTADQAAADQGTGTESSGAVVIQDQNASNEGANTQAPESGPAVVDDNGDITNTSATVPSNAETAAQGTPTVPAAPPTFAGSSAAADQPADGNDTVNTGTVAPSSQLQTGTDVNAEQFYIYKAISVVSKFTGGKFMQDLEGALVQIPVRRSRQADGTLVPEVPNAADNDEDTTATTNERDPTLRSGTTSATSVTNTASVTQPPAPVTDQDIPAASTDSVASGAPQPDPTTFGPAQDAPPTSDGQPVATVQPSGNSGEGSATTTVGGFTIKASSGSASNGVFVTVFVISRNGVQGFANDINGIVAAAQSVQQRSFGGVVEDVAQWVGGGGAARLQQQAEAQAQPRPAATESAINLARET